MKDYLKCLFKILVILIAYYLLQVLVSAAVAMVGGMNATGDIVAAMEEFILANTSLISLIHNIIVVLAIFLLSKNSVKEELRLVKIKGSILSIAALGVFGAMCVSALLSLLPLPEDMLSSYSTLMQDSTNGLPLIQFVSTVIAAPIAEEFLFRGVIYNSLRKHTSRYSAILVSCTVFGAMHQSPLWMVYAFVLGVVMTLIYDGCGSLFASIIFHIFFNFFGSYGVSILGAFGIGGIPLLVISLAGVVFFARRLVRELKACQS